MVRFIDYDCGEVGREALEPCWPRERLHGGEHDLAVVLIAFRLDHADILESDDGELLARLPDQLVAVYQDQRAAATLANQLDEHNGLSCARGQGEHLTSHPARGRRVNGGDDRVAELLQAVLCQFDRVARHGRLLPDDEAGGLLQMSRQRQARCHFRCHFRVPKGGISGFSGVSGPEREATGNPSKTSYFLGVLHGGRSRDRTCDLSLVRAWE